MENYINKKSGVKDTVQNITDRLVAGTVNEGNLSFIYEILY